MLCNWEDEVAKNSHYEQKSINCVWTLSSYIKSRSAYQQNISFTVILIARNQQNTEAYFIFLVNMEFLKNSDNL